MVTNEQFDKMVQLAKTYEQAMKDALLLSSETTSDLIWAMEWIDTLSDALNTARDEETDEIIRREHGMYQEFQQCLTKRRKTSHRLDLVAKEVGL